PEVGFDARIKGSVTGTRAVARARVGRGHQSVTVSLHRTRGDSMMSKPHCPVIALEEHYWDPELAAHYTGTEAGRACETWKRLHSLGAHRLKEMDEAGVDMQVLSHGAPSTQKLPAAVAADLTRRVNDRLAATVAANPKRFAAFAALPTADPGAAADELERT